MIVNDDVVVDKKSFLHKISSLRRRELTGQGLYPASIDIGEKTACRSRRRFCTSDPVHIQRLVHSRTAFRPLFAGKTGVEQCFRYLAGRIRRSAAMPAACPWRMRLQPGRDRDRVWHLLSSRFDSADKTRSNRTGKISAGSNKRVLSSRFFRSR